MAPPTSAAAYIVNHVVLPPDLPQTTDQDVAHEAKLLEITHLALQDLKGYVKDGSEDTIIVAMKTIKNLLHIRDDMGFIKSAELKASLDQMVQGTGSEVIALEIKVQNAGLIIRRDESRFIFESFELSPTNEAIMMCKGRLNRSFPGNASSIPLATMRKPGYTKSLASALATMSSQAVSEFQPAHRVDTPHPGIVTDYLMSVFAAMGESVKVPRILKHTRDEVLSKQAPFPWRRAPLWLLVRVTLQLTFARQQTPPVTSNELYKVFGVLLLSRTLASTKGKWQTLGCDSFRAISTKIVRRLHKLEFGNLSELLRPQWCDQVEANLKDAQHLLSSHWSNTMTGTKSIMAQIGPSNMRPDVDLDIPVPMLNGFLTEAKCSTKVASAQDFRPTIQFPVYSANSLPSDLDVADGNQIFRLAAAESWVEKCLQTWVNAHAKDPGTCGELYHLMQAYYAAASAVYSDNPTSISIMYLTLCDIWVQCDILACNESALLQKYDPAIRLEELQCLSLPLRNQMERLHTIELYLQSRYRAATRGYVSVFHEFGHASSFAVKYFDSEQGANLRILYANIDRKSEENIIAKQEELADLKTQYRELMEQHNSTQCEYEIVAARNQYGNSVPTSVHSNDCTRCDLKDQAKSLNISIYERTLSTDENKAKATVFELQMPVAFGHWRDATYFMMNDVLGIREESPKKPSHVVGLDKHHDLDHIISERHQRRRIVIVSTTKSRTAGAGPLKAVHNLQETDVCLENTLKYTFYDRTNSSYIDGIRKPKDTVLKSCTFPMPTRSQELRRYLSRPPSAADGLPSNEVIADQANCPGHFSVDEFKAFGTLPLGREIIYENILVQLAMPSLDFAKAETHSLLQQVALQAGPSNGQIERTVHSRLQDTTFSNQLLAQLDLVIRRMSENWESWTALAIVGLLTRRILSMTSTSEVTERCLQHLVEVRRVCLNWLRTLEDRVMACTDQKQRGELYRRTLDIALLGASTFDVDEDHVSEILGSSSGIAALLRCSIKIRENEDSVKLDADGMCRNMHQSWKRLMYRISPTLQAIVLRDNTGLNEAILASWVNFQPGSQWTALSDPNCQCLRTVSGTLIVHFDLLTGDMLVNGLPLTRLPTRFTQHSTYERLFGKAIMEVGPSDVAEMDFAAKSTRHGYQIHFGTRDRDMLVLAVKEGLRLELVPARVFENALPNALLTQYVHWYDRVADEVHFRDRSNPWLCGPKEWSLKRSGMMWRLMKDSHVLVNIFGGTARKLQQVFQPLEDGKHIHITCDSATSTVDISLPRLKLNFYMTHQSSQIRSRQYRGMIIDLDQNIGTLVGLSSKLVLCNEARDERMFLVPLPETLEIESIQYCKISSSGHVDVTIAKGAKNRICAYTLDSILGRILDCGDLQSKLLLAYLHALTAFCLPDPFTGCTGTESALNILRSASTRSFEVLTIENVNILTSIAKLTPGRTLQSEHRQQIHWDNKLAISSQHPLFFDLVKEILDEDERVLFLHPGSKKHEPRGLPVIKGQLRERDMIRGSTFRVHGFGAEAFNENEDSAYVARDANQTTDRGQRAFVAAELITRDVPALCKSVPSLKYGLFEDDLSDAIIRSNTSHSNLADLCFHTKWLEDSSSNLAEHWCSLHLFLPEASKKATSFDIMLWLSAMAYSTTANMEAIQVLASFYRVKDMASIKPPTTSSSFERARGSNWITKDLEAIFNNYKRPPSECPEASMPMHEDEDPRRHTARIGAQRRKNAGNAVKKFLAALNRQWPSSNPLTPPTQGINVYFHTSNAMGAIKERIKSWHDNLVFDDYLDRVSAIIASQEVVEIPALQQATIVLPDTGLMRTAIGHFTADSIFAVSAPDSVPTPPSEPDILLEEKVGTQNQNHAHKDLKGLCRDLGVKAGVPSQKAYVKSLRRSCDALKVYEIDTKTNFAKVTADTRNILDKHLHDCKKYFDALNQALSLIVRGNAGSHKDIACSIQHTPRTSPSFWLRYLNRTYFDRLSESWKSVIIEYARAITHLHRAHRMTGLSEKPLELAQELQYVGHTNWSPRDYPETLLLEAESCILVREVQETIAQQMRSPPNNENAMCQLNMGEGKSSVIVPILAATLADAKRLVRIIIAKPQSRQMLEILIAKLGGLLNRRVYHLPFSRDLRLTKVEAKILRAICEECMANGGVILAQPEHILSFKLMSIETVLLDQKEKDIAKSLMDTQKFLDAHTRDIVDESDENFSPHFELVYTMGSQQAIDFAPERWKIIQQVLGLVEHYGPEVKENLPVSIELQESHEGAFPRIRLLRNDATEMLVRLVAKHIVKHGLPGLPARAFSERAEMEALQTYMVQQILSPDQITAIEASAFWTETTKQAILLVRGLLACGVLRFTLGSKRWRVDYGLDADRKPSTLLAVPYRFKDGPSPRAEYSHPDVLIILTLLSHYYGGLSDEQMFTAFEHLSGSDQADVQFSEWVSAAAPSLPLAFRTLAGINLKDRQHCIQEIFPHLRYSKACTDYFLSRLVFPKEMRQFMSKLSASGWDMGARKANATTGFSGTKDTMHVLPLTVKHLDLPSQDHVSALVLGYLLETSSVELLPPRTESTDAEHVLHAAVAIKPEVRVILDCGAAILEQTNKQVVEAWLEKTNPDEVHAAVFFEDNKLSVLDRTGRIEPLQTSPFAKQLDVCVVYLDEANTRGTDLKLPRHYRACLTLGNALSKDKLIQGCMRMRQLGKGQSVVFLAPEEIATKIYELTSNDFDDPVTVRDVLYWSVRETWNDLKKSMPLWAVQGHRFISQQHLLQDSNITKEQAKEFLEDEGQNIESRYSPTIQGNKLTAKSKNWDLDNQDLNQIVVRCQGFGAIGDVAAEFEEEQERELAPEQEEQREVERPKKMEPSKHDVHKHLQSLTTSGKITKTSRAFTPAFQSLQSTSAADLGKLAQFPTDLLVSADFMKTVKKPTGTKKGNLVSDLFQRTVQWVISVPNSNDESTIQHLVIISPHEANKLRPSISRTKKVTLHLFAPRTNSSCAPLDMLDLYTVGRDFDPSSVPRSLIAQLNLFAGSLYLRSLDEYVELCDFLGLLHGDAVAGQRVGADGFITPPAGKWGLKDSPVPLLRALLMRIRKEGDGLEVTHLGKMLNGIRLEEADFRVDTEMSEPMEEGF
ncbi:hypothetical protein FB567DRAFT_624053 [Paraphoma chrysanthemicola]|uniref:ubiquitinyl hydrolase 1 n=1 Tax=Paraphoma chrysanthemicola TaxID=798071 RepID=A0A8K0RI83_9PLEO|nr:hypothetical protein FB567DRAFT_624053 [Paraphoma chrysanthemicola]